MKTIRIILLILIIIGIVLLCTQSLWVNPLVNFILEHSNSYNTIIKPVTILPDEETLLTYNNADYGFTFSLPADWKGYSIVKKTWNGNSLTTDKVEETGPTLLIRNPKWTSAIHYEDIPIMVFTLAQWNSYTAENFAVSAAPIPASELGRNNRYVFALPPRWDFDFSQGYQEAENILNTKPLHPFNL
jgi:hypothetical protein